MSDPIKEAEAMYNEVEVFEPSPGIQALTAYEIKLRAALRSLIEHAKDLNKRATILANWTYELQERAEKAESERDNLQARIDELAALAKTCPSEHTVDAFLKGENKQAPEPPNQVNGSDDARQHD